MKYELRLTLGRISWTISCVRPSNKAALANGMRILRHRRLNNEDIEARIISIDGKRIHA